MFLILHETNPETLCMTHVLVTSTCTKILSIAYLRFIKLFHALLKFIASLFRTVLSNTFLKHNEAPINAICSSLICNCFCLSSLRSYFNSNRTACAKAFVLRQYVKTQHCHQHRTFSRTLHFEQE